MQSYFGQAKSTPSKSSIRSCPNNTDPACNRVSSVFHPLKLPLRIRVYMQQMPKYSPVRLPEVVENDLLDLVIARSPSGQIGIFPLEKLLDDRHVNPEILAAESSMLCPETREVLPLSGPDNNVNVLIARSTCLACPASGQSPTHRSSGVFKQTFLISSRSVAARHDT